MQGYDESDSDDDEVTEDADGQDKGDGNKTSNAKSSKPNDENGTVTCDTL